MLGNLSAELLNITSNYGNSNKYHKYTILWKAFNQEEKCLSYSSNARHVDRITFPMIKMCQVN